MYDKAVSYSHLGVSMIHHNTKYIGIHLGERVSNVVYIIGLVTKVDLP